MITMSEPSPDWKPIITRLWGLIQSEPGWHDAFNYAVKQARSYNVPMEDITDTKSYCDYMNKLLSWVPTEQKDGRTIYHKICVSYFILDQPALQGYQTEVHPASSGHPLTKLSEWIVDYAKRIGEDWLDTPASITPESIKHFYDAPRYHMDDYIQPEGGWTSFNDFFARHLKKGKRPIDALDDLSVIVSPTDSVFDSVFQVDDGVIDVKGVPWGMKELLAGSKYADSFKNGIFMHAFLNTNDYHRQHAPISGTVLEISNIQGAAYLEVVAKDENNNTVPFNINRPSSFNTQNRLVMQRKVINPEPTKFLTPVEGGPSALDNTGYQFLQLRGMIVIDSPIGLCAVLPIGMAQVSSVVITCHPKQVLEKGDEISYFQFGGSDIVVVFEDGKVEYTAKPGTHYNMGEAIGKGKVPQIPIPY